jgi:hypothetical protein
VREQPKRARPELLGHAFCELIEHLDPHRLPTSGGINATVVVTLDCDTLLTRLATATLETGERISAGLARRMACEAGIIPAVVRRLVDGTSAVLDLGRKRRLHRETQCIALASRAAAPPRAATARRPGARPTTTSPGLRGARRASPTDDCSAATTMAGSTAHYGAGPLPSNKVTFHRRT